MLEELDDLPPNYEPDPHDRVYFRRARDGQLGWHVRKDGQDYIKLDRASQDIRVPYRPSEWIEERDRRPLTRVHVAQIALAADNAMCHHLGLHKESRREWLSMLDEERRNWITDGPSDRKERMDLWAAIMEGLKDHSK